MSKRPRRRKKGVEPVATEEPIVLAETEADKENNELAFKEESFGAAEAESIKIDAEILSEVRKKAFTPMPKPTKRDKIDALLANPCKFYPAPTSMQWGTEMWPWLKQLATLLEEE